MYHEVMRAQLSGFVESLAIPAERKPIVLAELVDHVTSAMETAVREGADPELAARAALGDLEALRAQLESVEPAFRFSRPWAIARGIVAALLVAIVVDRTVAMTMLWLGALAALAIVGALAPRRALEMLRAELRGPRVRGRLAESGIAIGPALAYALVVIAGPPVVWIGLITKHALAGDFLEQTPWSAFVVMAVIGLVIAVEAVRARRDVVA